MENKMAKTTTHPMRRATDKPTRRLRQEDAAPETARAPRVMQITCAETGEVFTHVQTGRGRPPKYSPEVRARREAKSQEPTERKQAALRKMTLLEGATPEVDQYVMRITTGMRGENALPWMVPARVIQILEDGKAQVERTYDHEVSVVNLDKLIPIQVR
jgi:hypothetical protein